MKFRVPRGQFQILSEESELANMWSCEIGLHSSCKANRNLARIIQMAASDYASYIKWAYINYSAGPVQKSFNEDAKRSAVAVCHRGFGKTVLAVNQFLWRILSRRLNRPRGPILHRHCIRWSVSHVGVFPQITDATPGSLPRMRANGSRDQPRLLRSLRMCARVETNLLFKQQNVYISLVYSLHVGAARRWGGSTQHLYLRR